MSISKKVSNKLLFFSERTTLYRLPSNLNDLNEMSPIYYLKKYTVVPVFRKKVLKNLFNKHKYEESLIQMKSIITGEIINKEGLFTALKEISQDLLNTKSHLNDIIEFLDLNFVNEFDFDEFNALILFAELYFKHVFYGNYRRELSDLLNYNLEKADFKYLFSRTDSKELLVKNKNLSQLLDYILRKVII